MTDIYLSVGDSAQALPPVEGGPHAEVAITVNGNVVAHSVNGVWQIDDGVAFGSAGLTETEQGVILGQAK